MDDEIVYSIRESDLEKVEIDTDFDDGRIQAYGWIVFPSETPETLRDRAAFGLEEALVCEAAARYKEGRTPTPTKWQNHVANSIYRKQYSELPDYAKNVVNRVAKNCGWEATDAP